MDQMYNNNGTHNKPSLNKSRSNNNNFGNAAVHKTDVGDFKEGYFVMADVPPLPQQRPNKTHKTPERTQRKNDLNRTNNSRERSTKDLEQLVRESDNHVSHGRLPTSPTRSPPRYSSKRNFHSPPQQVPQTSEQPLSPHKPRKAHYHEKYAVRTESFSLDNVSGSPPKDKGPSPPPSTRWAGPAFSNAPPPSSLPMPEFPPFQSPVMSSSPPGPTTLFAPVPSHPEPQFYAQPLYAPSAYQPIYSVQFSYADVPYQPQNQLAQLSTDLRRMLNISHPIPA